MYIIIYVISFATNIYIFFISNILYIKKIFLFLKIKLLIRNNHIIILVILDNFLAHVVF